MFLCLRRFLIVCAHRLKVFLSFLFPAKLRYKFGRRTSKEDKKIFYRHPPKPAWVREEIIRFKAFMPEAGCRTIAHTFNRRFAKSNQMTVSKTFANAIMRKHNYEIQVARRKIRNKRPKDVPNNLIWGMDLTGKTDEPGNLNNILGIVEHKSRMSLSVVAIKDKSTITILRFLFDVVEHYGKPRFLRTDNEPVFTSWLMRFSLWLMGIRHQRIELCCPWQNGRVERFFGTLKEKLNQWHVNNREQLNGALGQFQFWYNHVRPHQNLDGRTPVEVWNGVDVFKTKPKKEFWFEAWDGLLTGIYLRL